MKKLEVKQMEQIEGGKFWGTGKVKDCSAQVATGTCIECDRNFVFWIPVGAKTNCHMV